MLRGMAEVLPRHPLTKDGSFAGLPSSEAAQPAVIIDATVTESAWAAGRDHNEAFRQPDARPAAVRIIPSTLAGVRC